MWTSKLLVRMRSADMVLGSFTGALPNTRSRWIPAITRREGSCAPAGSHSSASRVARYNSPSAGSEILLSGCLGPPRSSSHTASQWVVMFLLLVGSLLLMSLCSALVALVPFARERVAALCAQNASVQGTSRLCRDPETQRPILTVP